MTLEEATAAAAVAAADWCEAAMLATKELTNSCVVRPNRFMVSKESKATASLLLISEVDSSGMELLGEDEPSTE